MIFDVTGASVSHAASGDDLGKILVPLVFGAVVVVSWALRPASRMLVAPQAVGAEPSRPNAVAPSAA
jgi:hypothetical protein